MLCILQQKVRWAWRPDAGAYNGRFSSLHRFILSFRNIYACGYPFRLVGATPGYGVFTILQYELWCQQHLKNNTFSNTVFRISIYGAAVWIRSYLPLTTSNNWIYPNLFRSEEHTSELQSRPHL